MTRLENVIETVKEYRTVKNHAWIFNDDGKISDGVICGEILDLLEELKEYEINVTDEWLNNFSNNINVSGNNTYNFGALISNDFNYEYIEGNDYCIIKIMIHLFGDIRGNYTEYFAVKFDSIDEFYSLESINQTVSINDRYVADICLLSEGYNVYDIETGKDVGYYYEMEKEELLKELNR